MIFCEDLSNFQPVNSDLRPFRMAVPKQPTLKLKPADYMINDGGLLRDLASVFFAILVYPRRSIYTKNAQLTNNKAGIANRNTYV